MHFFRAFDSLLPKFGDCLEKGVFEFESEASEYRGRNFAPGLPRFVERVEAYHGTLVAFRDAAWIELEHASEVILEESEELEEEIKLNVRLSPTARKEKVKQARQLVRDLLGAKPSRIKKLKETAGEAIVRIEKVLKEAKELLASKNRDIGKPVALISKRPPVSR